MLHTKSYQDQITNLLEAEKHQLKGIDLSLLSWDSLLEEEMKESEQSNSSDLDELFVRYGVANA